MQVVFINVETKKFFGPITPRSDTDQLLILAFLTKETRTLKSIFKSIGSNFILMFM